MVITASRTPLAVALVLLPLPRVLVELGVSVDDAVLVKQLASRALGASRGPSTGIPAPLSQGTQGNSALDLLKVRHGTDHAVNLPRS